MKEMRMRLFKKLMSQVLCMALMLVCGSAVNAQQTTGNLRGQVTDELGGAINGATVTLIDANNLQKTVTTNDQGSFAFNGLPQGKYFLRVIANGFALYENESVEIGPGHRDVLSIKMTVTIEKQKVTVTSDGPALSTEADNNAGAIVLKGKDLDALPDDPDDLAAALQAMAGPSAGPNGGQLYIDGFTGGSMPPKEAIREIRINQNPFAAENDRIGFGRIEILTKPGADKYHGSAFFNFNNQDFNSRNPFVPNRPDFLYRTYGGSINGPIMSKRATFFVNFFKRDIDDNAIVNATILDSSLNKVTFSQAIVAPIRRTEVSPRFDYQLTKNNTLVARYSYEHNSFQNQGVGGFSLPSTAFNSLNTESSVRLTETAVLSSAVINETRFQFLRTTADRMGDNSTPTIQVGGAFTGGGSNVGKSANVTHRWEVQNYTTWSVGKHTFKFGGRVRRVTETDVSFGNFGGTFSFFGAIDPQNPSGVLAIDVYRRTLLLQQEGLTPAQIVAMGGGPSQFTIVAGNPSAGVRQLDAGIFAQDDWKLRPNFTLSLGLRYEAQDHVADKTDLAPRVAFAWSPGGSANSAPKTVIRGGSGIFYDRFSEALTLQASRFNGIEEQQFIVTDPLVLASVFPKVPSIATLESSATPQNIFRVAGNLTAPYIIQSSISLEQQLPRRFTLTATYINARGLHNLRARDINAPLPGTAPPRGANAVCGGARPFGFVNGVCNIFEYESSGIFKQNQLVISLANRFNKYFTVQGFYVLGKTESDTDGSGTFPANSFDLRGEFGRTSFDARHRAFVFGNINLPHQVSLSPFVVVSSGLPFNITTGIDSNGDSLTTDRPAFATSSSKSVKVTQFGTFDLTPLPGETIIPRNFGQGPGSFTVNLRAAKTFGFGKSNANVQAANRQAGMGGGGGQMIVRGAGGGAPGGGGRPGSGGPGGGGPGGGGGMFGGGGGSDRPYSVTVSVFVTNVFNHVNPNSPVGNLTSPFFGRSLALGGGGFGGFGGGGGTAAMNRRVDLQVRFNF
jgi:hypothetical protein